MTISEHTCTPFEGQRPGTSGLRKKTQVFMQPGYLEAFVQAIFNGIGGAAGKSFVVGGDGRFFNRQAIQTILRMAAANGAREVIVGQNGLLSTPAASHLIRLHQTDGGLILSASHNPGGIDADFGLKFNIANGGPAPESITDAIFAGTKTLTSYTSMDAPEINLSIIGSQRLGEMDVRIVDPVEDYAALMGQLFDFGKIRALIADGFQIRFDAMHAVTGPYATHILETLLGAPEGSVLNGIPSEDFGKGHPDPNPIWAKPLVDLAMSAHGPDFAAASDGDGDRNMILGKGIYVTPSDSLAVLAANIHLAPGYKSGLAGIARSMPTSRAADHVAEHLGVACFETPTGWKFFGNLLDDGRVTICGEESAGTGSDHVREKDGLWAVLLWLNILAERRLSVAHIMADHWARFGRHYYSRHDYEAIAPDVANALMSDLVDRLAALPNTRTAGTTVTECDQFAYHDPVDGSVSLNQGVRLFFEGGARAVMRLSGTGTEGATLRIYLERYESAQGNTTLDTQDALRPVRDAVLELTNLQNRTGRTAPDVMT